jgi:4-amino-4-deoxy-L-arabinose transferase-like glycosyltransferase
MRRPATSRTLARPGRALWLVVAVAIAVRALYALSYLGSPLAVQHRADQGYYRAWAQQIAAGDVLGREVFEQGPLYAYALALVYRACGPRDAVAIALQLLAGVATSALAFACARRLFSERAALVTGVACAAFGPLVFYEAMVMKTFLSPLATIATVYAGLRYAAYPRARWLAAGGLAVGLACLVRENHVLLAVPLAFQLLAVGRARGLRARAWLAHAAALAAAIAVPIAPAALRNHAVSREWVAVTSGGGEVFYIAHGPHANGYFALPPFVDVAGPEEQHAAFRAEAARRLGHEVSRAESSRYWAQEALREAVSHPARSARLVAVKLSGWLADFEAPSDQFYAVTRGEIPWLRALPTFGWVVGLGPTSGRSAPG